MSNSNQLDTSMTPRLSFAFPGLRRRPARAMIMSERAQFDLARRLRSDEPPTLGEVFTFLSGLYFRGKLAYAKAFSAAGFRDHAKPRPASAPICRFGSTNCAPSREVDINEDDPRYRKPLAARCEEARPRIAGGRGDRAARQHRDRQVCRSAAGEFRRTPAVSGGFCRTRRHEPRRLAAALRGRSDAS